jgi:hypothetical protein
MDANHRLLFFPRSLNSLRKFNGLAKPRIGISIPIDELDNLQGLLLNAMLRLDARRGSLV